MQPSSLPGAACTLLLRTALSHFCRSPLYVQVLRNLDVVNCMSVIDCASTHLACVLTATVNAALLGPPCGQQGVTQLLCWGCALLELSYTYVVMLSRQACCMAPLKVLTGGGAYADRGLRMHLGVEGGLS